MTFDPRFLSFERWTALIGASLLPFGNVQINPSEKNWREWAQAVRNLPRMTAIRVPRPDGFASWQEWGYRLNEALLTIGL